MGIFKLLRNIFNAEGIREAVRISYIKHMKGAPSKTIPESSIHFSSMLGVLMTRYRSRGIQINEIAIYGEISPFLCMDPLKAIEALAEYIVFIEKPWDARINWLKNTLNQALQLPERGPEGKGAQKSAALMLMEMGNAIKWYEWLEPQTLSFLQEIASSELESDNS
jgi:hypothetical protein